MQSNRLRLVLVFCFLGYALCASTTVSNAQEKPSAKPKQDTKSKDDAEKKKSEEKKEPPKTEVRLLKLSGNYVDKTESMGIDPVSLLMGVAPGKQKSFYRLCDYIDSLAKEDELKHVVFDLSSSYSFNDAQLDELTRRLTKLKDSNKIDSKHQELVIMN